MYYNSLKLIALSHISQLHFAVIGFQRRDPDEDGDDVRFPAGLDDLTNTSFDNIPAEITLPPALFRERRMPGSESTMPLHLCRP